MSTESERPPDLTDRFPRVERAPAPLTAWLAPLVVGVVGVGLVVAAGIADGVDHPTAPRALTVAGAVVGVLLMVLATATRSVVVRSESQWLSVFPARRTCGTGIALVALAGGFVAALLWRHPFEYLIVHFRIGAPDIADAGLVLAAVICLVTAGVAFLGAWDARCAERSWADAARRR